MTKQERIKIRNERMRLRNEKIKAARGITTTTITTYIPKEKLTLEICIHCHNYQKRLVWMLSSILQQKGNIPEIIVNISYTPNTGNPTTEEVCKFFKEKGLNIVETIIPPEQVKNRAVARNIQTIKTTADYMLFADSDMVYSEEFFSNIHEQLKTNLKDETRVMGADRVSLEDKFCIKYFEEDDKRQYPCIIDDVGKIVAEWPVKWVTGRNVAPGNFQLASVRSIKEHGGKYSRRQSDCWRATRSDRQFRCRMGGRVGISVLKQYHLNHGRELGIQR